MDAVPTAEDHSFLESDLIAEIAKRLTAGTAADRERRALTLMEAHNRQGHMMLFIPGLRPKPDIPADVERNVLTALLDLYKRRMSHDDIDQMLMAHFPDLSMEGLARAWEAAFEQVSWEVDSQKILHDLFEKWDAAERAKGRPEAELVFGNFVRETGLLRAEAPQ
jgi:hypothetical protein